VPNGWFLDESGESVKDLEFAPSDLLAAVVGLAAASLDFASGHHNYTFNNLIACLICCDILQVCALISARAFPRHLASNPLHIELQVCFIIDKGRHRVELPCPRSV